MAKWFHDPEAEERRRQRAELKARIERLTGMQERYDGKTCSKCGEDYRADLQFSCHTCGWYYCPRELPEEEETMHKETFAGKQYGTGVCRGNRLFRCGKQFVKHSPSQTACCREHTASWAKNHPGEKGEG